MENDPFIDGLPIKNCDFPWQTVSHNQMVILQFSRPGDRPTLTKAPRLRPLQRLLHHQGGRPGFASDFFRSEAGKPIETPQKNQREIKKTVDQPLIEQKLCLPFIIIYLCLL
jgi:hypothetical protein